jgi:coenzyme F420-0:L-glutamate ligase/coenzyme F420-1:gamma-L-glutamate ligase
MGTILATALPALPEVRPGDDLAALIAASWQALASRQADLAPHRGDVLVVTQKVVSKAEGCVLDLATIEPRAEAVEFAARWDRDARQVEVVLRESAEIVRMERGLVISRTRHGFVCANAGVDASNTGGQDLVTLLPTDPDASAARLHDRLPALLGLEPADAPAVVISDSFGRPWRFGITDVALGVAGIEPLLDLRDTPDADGRTMHSTVVAVADEICAAAELAKGKTSRRPVVLVRGAEFGKGPGTVTGDVVMPAEMDLFR